MLRQLSCVLLVVDDVFPYERTPSVFAPDSRPLFYDGHTPGPSVSNLPPLNAEVIIQVVFYRPTDIGFPRALVDD